MDDVDFQRIVEQLPLVVYVDALDADSTPIYVSPQTQTTLGYSPKELERRNCHGRCQR